MTAGAGLTMAEMNVRNRSRRHNDHQTVTLASMIESMRPIRNLRPVSFVAAVLFASFACLAGCTHSAGVAHVKGKVTFKGIEPNTQIKNIGFLPTADSTAEIRKGASSAIGADGSYELWTRKPGDGIYVGEYDVIIIVSKSATDQTSLIPPKYATRTTTPFKNVKIDKSMDDLNFEVDMAAGAGG
jgi:hypothetical protein